MKQINYFYIENMFVSRLPKKVACTFCILGVVKDIPHSNCLGVVLKVNYASICSFF